MNPRLTQKRTLKARHSELIKYVVQMWAKVLKWFRMKANEWHYENEGGEIRIFRRGMRLGRQPPRLLKGMLRLRP